MSSSASINNSLHPAIERFVAWLESYGETSQDHQDFYAGDFGRRAKELYYRRPVAGKLAVMPMVVCEAFAPWTRRFFFPRMRLPIADAHFAMAYAGLHRLTGNPAYYQRAVHFLGVLEATRCPSFERYGWGYPFDWQTKNGIIPSGTPLITTTPYCYEAFVEIFRIDEQPRWKEIARSIAEHVRLDYRDVNTGPGAASCTYTPSDGARVVNASAYRASTLYAAWRDFGDEQFRLAAEQNLAYVLQAQQPDGSWPYATDGARAFVDHFHTCFVLKSLAKIERVTERADCSAALGKGIEFYLRFLFDEDGLPRPFARAPRLTIYRRELYDCAECINLGVLLSRRFPDLDEAVARTVKEIIGNWQLRTGQFRSRRLLFGWDNVPMHRWGQSEIFRALVLYAETCHR